MVASVVPCGRAARLRQTLGGRSGGPLVRSIVALAAAKRNAHNTQMFAWCPHVGGAINVETYALLRCFHAHRAVWNVRQIGANPAAALQIGGRNYAPSAANFLAVSMQKIDAFSAKSKIGGLGEKGRILGGQDKGNRHSVDAVSGQALVCTLFWGGAGGTVVFEMTCRTFAQSLGFAGF